MALFGDAAFIATVGVLYAVVAGRVHRRRMGAHDDARALLMFELWWVGISTLFLTAALATAILALDVRLDPVVLALAIVGALAVCTALWGLVYYVTYIFSGRRGALWPFALYYAACAVVLVGGFLLDPGEPRAWARSVSSLTIHTGTLVTATIFAFLAPVIVACGFYASLYTRLDDPEQKMRVGFTATAFIGWFGSAIVAATTGLAGFAWWAPVGQGIGVIASALVLLAWWPPKRLIRRAALALAAV